MTGIWLLDTLNNEPEGEEGNAFGEEEAPGVSPLSATLD